MDASECCNCHKVFEEKSKGFKRTNLESLASPRTVGLTFPDLDPASHTFICYKCERVLRSRTVLKGQGRKRTFVTDTVSSGTSGRPTLKQRRVAKVKKVNSSIAQAITYLKNRQFLKAVKILFTTAVRKSMLDVVCQAVIQERKAMVKDHTSPLQKKPSLENIEMFSWGDIMSWLAIKAPISNACLTAMLPSPNIIRSHRSVGRLRCRRIQTEEEATDFIMKRKGMALAIMLNTSTSKVRFLQGCIGISMYKQGCPGKMFQTLNSLGVCQSKVTSRRVIDEMRKGLDQTLKVWKDKIEKHSKEGPSPEKEMTFSVTWDNVQIYVQEKHHSRNSPGNKVLLWALSFAHLNKVSFNHLAGTGMKAMEVSPYHILPSKEDYSAIKYRMTILVMQVLADNLTALQPLKQKVIRHIDHLYHHEMSQKSELVNLGVIETNPSSLSGVIEIMEALHKYVPIIDGKPFPLLCCGDGLSIERMNDAHHTRVTHDTPAERLEGLVEAPQDFHKEMILLQDDFDLLFNEKSMAARGTLSQMRIAFDHRSLKKEVKKNFQHAADMMVFSSSAYITACAANFLGIGRADEDVPEFHLAAEKLQWLYDLAEKVVDFCWLAPKQEEIDTVAAIAQKNDGSQQIYPFCHCREDKGGDMLQCCSYSCPHIWSHLACTELTSVPEGDWYCSPVCEDSGSYIYCTCHKKKGGKMVQCHLEEQCLHNEWYHIQCLRPEERKKTGGEWYCSTECHQSQSQDKVLNYTKALMWRGLCHMARQDCIREGDGPALIQFWKHDLLSFWQRKHHKYLILAHRMLTGIEGYLPERLCMEMVWGRVANVTGGLGKNIPLDLANEFMNNEFKETLKWTRGRYTPEQVARCAEMSGPFGRQFDQLFLSSGIGHFTLSHTSQTNFLAKQQVDIAGFVAESQTDDLFTYKPGRHHKGLENFHYPQSISKPEKMGQTLKRLAFEMDLWDPKNYM